MRNTRETNCRSYLLKFFSLLVVCQLLIMVTAWWRSPKNYKSEDDQLPILHHHCDEYMPQLTIRLSEDHMKNALRPLRIETLANSNQAMLVNGMSKEYLLRMFSGHRIAFLGDSTLYYFTKWMYTIMHQSESKPLFCPFAIGNLTRANEEVKMQVERQCRVVHESQTNASCVEPLGHESPIPVEDELHDEYYMQWAGMSGIMDSWTTDLKLKAMWATVESDIRPDVMVVNMGLHWLHFYTIARNTGPQAIVRWVHYEAWLQQVLDKAREYPGVKMLLYKTTNLVCDSKMTGLYAKAVKLYGGSDAQTLRKCERSVGTEFSRANVRHNITDLQISDYCANGTIDNHGSMQLNQRLRKFVDNLEPQPGLYVGVFNDSSVQHCNYTNDGDGLHYHSLNLLRIRLLANYLQCAKFTR